jgi:hypothetical protein
MERNLSKNIHTTLSVLGYYQMTGGIIGSLLLIWSLLTLSSFNIIVLVIFVSALLLFLFSMYCGYLLIRQDMKGIRLSIINQFLQLFSFAIGGYAYQYASGLYLTAGLDMTDSFNFIFGFGASSWKLNINTDSPAILVDFNLAALCIIFVLDNLKKRIKDEGNIILIEKLISE